MTQVGRYRARMVRGLVRALDDEAAHVRRYRRMGKACGLLGGVVLALASLAALDGREVASIWFVVAGAAGGLLVGLAVFYASSVEQWPVNREFLDVDAIREAARRDAP